MDSKPTPFVRRRISLGSGINPTKLVDTITQMARDEDEHPRLICQSKTSEAWCQLDRSAEEPKHRHPWLLQCGFGVNDVPETILDALFQGLVFEYELMKYDPGISVSLLIPDSISVETIANVIILVVTDLQNTESIDVELSLEFTARSER